MCYIVIISREREEIAIVDERSRLLEFDYQNEGNIEYLLVFNTNTISRIM